MTATKAKTAEQEYSELVARQFENWLDSTFSAAALKGVELFEHTVPSGMKFKVRRLTREAIIQCGGSASSLLAPHVMSKQDAADIVNDPKRAQAAFDAMSEEEQAAAVQKLSNAMRFMCVEPRIVLEPNGQSNCIPASRITLGDYDSLAAVVGKAYTGGDAALGLKTFRKKRR